MGHRWTVRFLQPPNEQASKPVSYSLPSTSLVRAKGWKKWKERDGTKERGRELRSTRLTSEHLQSEMFNVDRCFLVGLGVVVVLNEMDDVGYRKHA